MRRSEPISVSEVTGTVAHMKTTRPGQAGASPAPRAVHPAIAAANAAYIATLALPPLTQAQANRIRTSAEAAHERRAADTAAA